MKQSIINLILSNEIPVIIYYSPRCYSCSFNSHYIALFIEGGKGKRTKEKHVCIFCLLDNNIYKRGYRGYKFIGLKMNRQRRLEVFD